MTVKIWFNRFEDYAGYPTFKGQVLNGQQLWDIVEGLGANQLLYYTHLLTGISESVLLVLLVMNSMLFLMNCKSAA